MDTATARLEVVYGRGRLALAVLALAFFALVCVFGVAKGGAAGADDRPLQTATIVVALILAGMALHPLRLILRGDLGVMTLTPEGIVFHRPALGLVPWSGIAEVAHRRTLLHTSFGVRFRDPAPRLPPWTRVQFAMNRLADARAPHIALPIHLLETRPEAVLEAVRRLRRAVAS